MSHAAQIVGGNAAPKKEGSGTESAIRDMSIPTSMNTASIFMSKTASIAYLDIQGSSALKFTLGESVTRQIFLPEHFAKNSGAVQISNNILRRIHISKIFIAQGTKNSFPFPLGVRINNIPNSEYTCEGDAFVYIIPQNFTVVNDVCIFESSGDENLMKTWEEEFAKWNSDNLEILCAMHIPESDTVMVHVEHPVIQLLEKKFEEFGVTPPSQQHSATPGWRPVDSHTFARACAWLRDNILSKSGKTFDMSQINVTFSRLNNAKFTELPPSFFIDMPLTGTETVSELTSVKDKYANLTVQRPFNIDIKLSFQYRLPTMDTTPK